MKILLVNNPEKNDSSLETLKSVADILKQNKHKYNKDATRRGLLGKQDTSKFFEKAKKSIRKNDAMIVELTNPTPELGYLILEALTQRKPVLLLTKEDDAIDSDTFFSKGNSRFLMSRRYSKATLSEGVEDFLAFAAKKVDTKFILIITPAIDEYLRWKAKEEGVRKAEVVRRSIEEYMSKDETFTEARKS